MTKSLLEVTHRHVTANHYLNGKKYMIWCYLKGRPQKTVGIVQVRGLRKPLTEEELKLHIDKLWERYEKERHSRNEHRVRTTRNEPC